MVKLSVESPKPIAKNPTFLYYRKFYNANNDTIIYMHLLHTVCLLFHIDFFFWKYLLIFIIFRLKKKKKKKTIEAKGS